MIKKFSIILVIFLNLHFRENFEFLNLRLDLKSEHFESAFKSSSYGWKKEAIPISQTKNSLISRIFQSLFN